MTNYTLHLLSFNTVYAALVITIKGLLVLFIGGGLGTICRHLVNEWGKSLGFHITLGTFLANVISSLLIGVFAAYFMRYSDDTLRLFFITGYCGGFSTFSTFSMENFVLIEQGKWMEVLIYVGLSLMTCIISVFIGMKIGSQLT